MKGCFLSALCVLALGLQAGTRVDDKGFIRDWLISGPWPNYQVKDRNMGLTTDHLKGERTILPYPGKRETATFVADWNVLVAAIDSCNEWGYRTNCVFDASWKVLHSETPIIRFNGTFAPIDDYFVTYAVCYVQTTGQVDAVFLVGSDDDHRLWDDQIEIGRAESTQDVVPGSFRYPVRLGSGLNRILFKLQDRTMGCGFCVQLLDKDEKPMKDVTIELDSRGRETTLEWRQKHECSPKRLQERRAAAQALKAESEARLAKVRSAYEAVSNRLASVKAELKATYAQLERDYDAERAANAAKGAKSVNEPLPPVEIPRATLCINGFWDSLAEGQTNWGKTYLPAKLPTFNHWRYAYPVQWGGKPLPHFEDAVNPVHGAKSSRLRTTFEWNGSDALFLRLDAIDVVWTDFLVNGLRVGDWNGDRGVVRVRLTNLKKGTNELEIDVRRPPVEPKNYLRQGIRGDIFLESRGAVRVDDVWVKSSWRKATLRSETTLANDGVRPVAAEVRAYAVKGGRIRHRLPVRRVEIPAGGTATAVAANGWADPETWGIGGAYGEPNLYTLVTDVVVDGRVADRHETEFGFREFWINATDFFLNGRRILLTGDVGHMAINERRNREVMWPLYRADGISLQRVHDSDQWSVTAARDADRMGMAICAQMYPRTVQEGETVGNIYNDSGTVSYTNFSPFASWRSTPAHRRNLAAYTRWWKDFRNHPSVLIWSTDNELVTQCWHSEARRAFNERNEQIGILYEKYVKSLDPDLVMTRDGDVGTWSHREAWHEDPPCDTANYHYPNANNRDCAIDWQAKYDYRPAIWGEAIYCAYFLNGRWVGARPDLVTPRAKLVRSCAKLYTDLEVPCPIYMGLGLDGFFLLDETGKGNPWGIKASDIAAWKSAKGPKPEMPGRKPGEYPWLRIPWPAYSGEGERPIAANLGCDSFGSSAFNVYDAGKPSHVRNAVNDAYRSALRPQPPLAVGRFAEAVVTARPHESVWTTAPGGTRVGVRADARGRAWFCGLEPGPRVFTAGARSVSADLPARGTDSTQPGFVNIPQILLPSVP